MTASSALRVLVVDDELLIRWAIGEALKEAGHTVVEADSASGVRRMLAGGVRPDVVLLDLRLPDSGSLDLLKDVRRMAPRSAILMMTAHGAAEVEAEALELGAYRVLAKPFDLACVAPLVREAFEKDAHPA